MFGVEDPDSDTERQKAFMKHGQHHTFPTKMALDFQNAFRQKDLSITDDSLSALVEIESNLKMGREEHISHTSTERER